MRKWILPVIAACSLIWPAISFGADAATEPAEPALPPVAVPPYITTGVREQTMPATNYMFVETDTTAGGMIAFIDKSVNELTTALRKGEIKAAGPVIFCYTGVTEDRTAPFHMTIGITVRDSATAVGDFQVKKLPEFHCATVIFSGPATQYRQSYRRLFSEMRNINLVPSGENREYFVYWEGQDSPNNVILIQSGLKSAGP